VLKLLYNLTEVKQYLFIYHVLEQQLGKCEAWVSDSQTGKTAVGFVMSNKISVSHCAVKTIEVYHYHSQGSALAEMENTDTTLRYHCNCIKYQLALS
jgi:hypothetical protein